MMLEADYSMATGIQLGTTCSDRDHERLMPQFASVHAVTPGLCTACVIAALFVLATIRAAVPQETQAFINQGLIQVVGMVGRGHWPPKPVPVLSTLPLVAAAKQRVKNSQILTCLLHLKAPWQSSQRDAWHRHWLQGWAAACPCAAPLLLRLNWALCRCV